MTALSSFRRSTAVALALGLGALGFAATAQADDGVTTELSVDSGSLQALQLVVQATDVAEEIPGAEDMPVDRGVVILPDHEMNDAMYTGDLAAVFNPKAFVQVSGAASVNGSEAGNLN
jgi:hypothetical protein